MRNGQANKLIRKQINPKDKFFVRSKTYFTSVSIVVLITVIILTGLNMKGVVQKVAGGKLNYSNRINRFRAGSAAVE